MENYFQSLSPRFEYVQTRERHSLENNLVEYRSAAITRKLYFSDDQPISRRFLHGEPKGGNIQRKKRLFEDQCNQLYLTLYKTPRIKRPTKDGNVQLSHHPITITSLPAADQVPYIFDLTNITTQRSPLMYINVSPKTAGARRQQSGFGSRSS